MILLFLFIAAIVLGSVAFMVFILSATIWADLKGAPFVRSKKDQIETMLALAEIRPSMRVLELGSGDGTLVVRAAKLGAVAEGIEINPFLVWYSRYRVRKAGLTDYATFARADIFKISLAEKKPDVLLLYLLPATLVKLREKLIIELTPGTRIISNAFHIEGLSTIARKNNIYVYRI